MVNFPISLDTLTNPTSSDKVGVLTHSTQHANLNDIAEALEAKVGVDGSAVTTSHDYKLGEVTGSDKAVGKSATQTLSNKTLQSPTTTGTDSGVATLENKTLVTPTIASFTNANHDHSSSSEGGQLNASTAFDSGTIPIGRLGSSGSPSSTTFLRGDNTWQPISVASVLGGDGSDGDVTISSGTTTLTRDMYYNNLTVNGTGILNTAGYKVFVKGTLTADNTSGAVIRNNGGDGGAGGNGAGGAGGAGGTAGSQAPEGSLPAGSIGKVGGAGITSNAAGNAGVAGDSVAKSAGVAGVAGGNGGAGNDSGIRGGGAGGALGSKTGTVINMPRSLVQAMFPFDFTSTTAIQRILCSAGSGSGGSGGNSSSPAMSGGGGGSGGSGGWMYIEANSAVLTGAGVIQANGGNGGAGGNGQSGDTGGGGGGGGGSGGVVIFVCQSKTGTGTVVVSGGTGGAGGIKGGGATSSDGASGSNGNDGTVINILAV